MQWATTTTAITTNTTVIITTTTAITTATNVITTTTTVITTTTRSYSLSIYGLPLGLSAYLRPVCPTSVILQSLPVLFVKSPPVSQQPFSLSSLYLSTVSLPFSPATFCSSNRSTSLLLEHHYPASTPLEPIDEISQNSQP